MIPNINFTTKKVNFRKLKDNSKTKNKRNNAIANIKTQNNMLCPRSNLQ